MSYMKYEGLEALWRLFTHVLVRLLVFVFILVVLGGALYGCGLWLRWVFR